MTKLTDILLADPPGCPPEAWSRQLRTASEVSKRFESGRDTVLLADEVGMGKTYVALAAMCQALFGSDESDRKVLLVTPPGNILRVKWQQEIETFNQRYLHPETRSKRNIQAIAIQSYWDLLRNLQEFRNAAVHRVGPEDRLCFIWCIFNWAFGRKLLGKKRRVPWVCIENLSAHHPNLVSFLSRCSVHALERFLDADYRVRSHFYQELFRNLRNDHWNDTAGHRAEVATLFKRFAGEQDRHEPNVFIIGMNALARPHIDQAENRLLSKYVLARLLLGKHDETRKAHAVALVRARVLPDEFSDKHAHRWTCYLQSMKALGAGEFYGLRDAVTKAINEPDLAARWRELSATIGSADRAVVHRFFNDVGDRVFAAQLARANFGLCVVDEVHNWKSGAFGARHFAKHYAPDIRRKLLMSATPFQMEEQEMAKLFAFAQAIGGGSESIMKSLYKPGGKIAVCLETSDAFAKAWQAVSATPADVHLIDEIYAGCEREALRCVAARIAEDAAESDEVRQFSAALSNYRRAIDSLQDDLGQVVIRHTKSREKRHFHIGRDFDDETPAAPRHSLYPVEGYASDDDALLNFVGMRLGQFVLREKKKSYEANARLLGGITSSKAAFLESARGMEKLHDSLPYRRMFEQMLEHGVHPKVNATVERAFDNYKNGRKTLIFCERVATLKEIADLLTGKIDRFVDSQASSNAIKRRSLLKQREQVENIWWHSLWDAIDQPAGGADMLDKWLPEVEAFAVRCLKAAGVKASARRIINLLDAGLIARAASDDRLAACGFSSAIALIAQIAPRLERDCDSGAELLKRFLRAKSGATDSSGANAEEFAADDDDEDGASDEIGSGDTSEDIAAAVDAVARHQYRERDNLWLTVDNPGFHARLWQLLGSEADALDRTGEKRSPSDDVVEAALVFHDVLDDLMSGVRRFTLRQDLLVRYERASEHGSHIARVARGLASMRIGHDQSMLARANRFMKSLIEADGSISRADLTPSRRRSLWQGVSSRQSGSVDVLHGKTPGPSRAGLCAAFNSPLLPDVLICTSIGSEGIDLHRQCADVIHHDLPWNPAKLEQRNGRVDRVGSLAQSSDELLINIGIPFLANNYEQFQYGKVYSRAQKFEILLGSPDFEAGNIDEEILGDESAEATVDPTLDTCGEEAVLCILPQSILDALKLDLATRDDGAASAVMRNGGTVTAADPVHGEDVLLTEPPQRVSIARGHARSR
ncbi:helicase [Caballeronia calidae]|uniref:Helicase n=1 Tax=Caballeronia calidae TaxID=1777139 RepID=A0A158EE73_9BURK|nr:helicase-related protein [Caballeronia calidae]SAL05165.1 helicase [Caballeronia calidae]